MSGDLNGLCLYIYIYNTLNLITILNQTWPFPAITSLLVYFISFFLYFSAMNILLVNY